MKALLKTFHLSGNIIGFSFENSNVRTARVLRLHGGGGACVTRQKRLRGRLISKQNHVKAPLKMFHLNGNTKGFHSQSVSTVRF